MYNDCRVHTSVRLPVSLPGPSLFAKSDFWIVSFSNGENTSKQPKNRTAGAVYSQLCLLFRCLYHIQMYLVVETCISYTLRFRIICSLLVISAIFFLKRACLKNINFWPKTRFLGPYFNIFQASMANYSLCIVMTGQPTPLFHWFPLIRHY